MKKIIQKKKMNLSIKNKLLCCGIIFALFIEQRLFSIKSFSYPSRSSSGRSYGSRCYSSRHVSQSQTKLEKEIPSSMVLILVFLFIFILMFFLSLRWLIDNAGKGDKQNVYKDYNQIAHWFDKNRSREGYEKKYLDQVINKIQVNGTVLDLGCGMAEPITKYFIEKGYQVTGVDGSELLIALARQRYPQEEFIVADMRSIDFDKNFDAIILWHSFFHLLHRDQRNMFIFFKKHLKVNGILLFTSGPEHGEVWSDNGGIDIYHASLSEQEYKKLLKRHGFELLIHTVEDKECGDATVWIAQLKEING